MGAIRVTEPKKLQLLFYSIGEPLAGLETHYAAFGDLDGFTCGGIPSGPCFALSR